MRRSFRRLSLLSSLSLVVACGDPFCGNGRIDEGEVCDDANQTAGDNCDPNCTIPACGNGFQDPSIEECDDGNTTNADGCTNLCIAEFCGDSVVNNNLDLQNPTEECDDGNADNTDSCAQCQSAVCGDGFVRVGAEACDDANTVSGDGCRADCQKIELCGDGALDDGEECDDANQDDTDQCVNLGGQCRIAACGDGFLLDIDGDGVIDPGDERCDDANTNSGDGCDADCAPSCGNGVLEAQLGEVCDDNNLIDSDDCTNVCQPARCGDGSLHLILEECDDGNLLNTDGCKDSCELPACGDNVVTAGEFCGFFPFGGVPGGSSPSAALFGDFNNDAISDIAVAYAGSDSLETFTGFGNGQFSGTQPSPVGDNPKALAAGDLNQDGNIDLVTANGSSSSVSVLFGNGDETFDPQQALTVGAFPEYLALGDLDNNGTLDIVTLSAGLKEVTTILGNGDGTFAPHQTFVVGPADGAFVGSIALADVDQDALPDLAIAGLIGNTVSILPGNGDGSFGAPQSFNTGNGPDSVVVASLNEDNLPDLVVSNTGSDTITVFLGNGAGTFLALQPQSVEDAPRQLVTGDFNLDTKIDLVVVGGPGVASPQVLLGDGDGTFSVAQNVTGSFVDDVNFIAAGEANSDGKPDLIFINSFANSVFTMRALF